MVITRSTTQTKTCSQKEIHAWILISLKSCILSQKKTLSLSFVQCNLLHFSYAEMKVLRKFLPSTTLRGLCINYLEYFYSQWRKNKLFCIVSHLTCFRFIFFNKNRYHSNSYFPSTDNNRSQMTYSDKNVWYRWVKFYILLSESSVKNNSPGQSKWSINYSFAEIKPKVFTLLKCQLSQGSSLTLRHSNFNLKIVTQYTYLCRYAYLMYAHPQRIGNGKTGHKGKDHLIMSNSGQKLWSAVWNLVCAYTLTHWHRFTTPYHRLFAVPFACSGSVGWRGTTHCSKCSKDISGH